MHKPVGTLRQKKWAARNLAATFLSQLCLGGEESGRAGTEKRVLGFVQWFMILYLSQKKKTRKNIPLSIQKTCMPTMCMAKTCLRVIRQSTNER